MDIAEDRGRFSDMLKELKDSLSGLRNSFDVDEAIEVAHRSRLSGFGSPKLCTRWSKNEDCDQ